MCLNTPSTKNKVVDSFFLVVEILQQRGNSNRHISYSFKDILMHEGWETQFRHSLWNQSTIPIPIGKKFSSMKNNDYLAQKKQKVT